MNTGPIPIVEITDERKRRLLALRDEFVAVINARKDVNPSLVLDALFDTYLTAAQSYGMMDIALLTAKANVELLSKELNVLPAAGAAVH